MSSLPLEIIDLIVDLLHNEPKALKACCIVSKAWIYRTRKHLFNHVKFRPRGRHVSRWRETFPDLLNSPAHHTQILSIHVTSLITAADVDTLLTFCGISHLDVDTTRWYDRSFSLLPLHRLSPAVRSLHLTFSSLQSLEILDLICSFPVLEDLTLAGHDGWNGYGAWNIPSTSPRLTGSLELRVGAGIQHITHKLLDFPNGLQFEKISVRWSVPQGIGSTANLVSRCSGTLESLKITNYLKGAFSRP